MGETPSHSALVSQNPPCSRAGTLPLSPREGWGPPAIGGGGPWLPERMHVAQHKLLPLWSGDPGGSQGWGSCLSGGGAPASGGAAVGGLAKTPLRGVGDLASPEVGDPALPGGGYVGHDP